MYNNKMKDNIRFGYFFHGYQGDTKYNSSHEPVSTPDGNATYSYSILYEAQKRGWVTFLMNKDRDWPGFCKEYGDLFKTFYKQERYDAYMNAILSDDLEENPKLDVLLLEWRWPIPGRNCQIDKSNFLYENDLDRQTELLNYYKDKGTKIIIFDLDHKLTTEDEIKWEPDAIFETALLPRYQHVKRTSVYIPCLSKFVDKESDFEYQTKNVILDEYYTTLAYVGSRYERDDVIDEYIKPFSERHPLTVKFYGNWLKTYAECHERWPNIEFCSRINVQDFGSAYSNAIACPLLAKRSYFETGNITARIWEALFFGTLPIGFTENAGIHQVLPSRLIANDAKHLDHIVTELSYQTLEERSDLRIACYNKWVEKACSERFVDKIEQVLNG
jgi:hypothetical protein